MADKCNKDIYEKGSVVAVLDGGSKVIEEATQNASKECGFDIDWYYFGGRAVVKTLGDVNKARESVLGQQSDNNFHVLQ
ncbi:MAG: hypothetical protein JXR12_05320 [Neptunomonas phycophila]|uniref:hypothetical protein n=1 Tax=Neptunomonas phycophila TaxID=1572645 RepID=UPI003B8E27BD